MNAQEPTPEPIEVIIGRHISLERNAYGNLAARCPFHSDSGKYLEVNPARQIWHCFGCHQGVTAKTFLELIGQRCVWAHTSRQVLEGEFDGLNQAELERVESELIENCPRPVPPLVWKALAKIGSEIF